MINRKIKRKLLVCLVVLEILVLSGTPNFAEAFLGSLLGIDDSAKSVAGDILKDFGVEELGEYAEISSKKSMAPTVKIEFSNPTPKPGEEITATALFNQAISNPKGAYYTWYLKREGGDEDNVELWKKTAVRQMIKKSFDPRVFDQRFNEGNNNGIVDDFEWEQNNTDGNGDAYVASNGGDQNKGSGEDQYYYIYDKEGGEFYELGDADGSEYDEDDDLYNECGDDHYPACMIDSNTGPKCSLLDPSLEGNASSSSSGGDGGDSGTGGSGGDSEANVEFEELPTAEDGMPINRCVSTGTPVCNSKGIQCPNGGKAYCVPKKSTSKGNEFLGKNNCDTDLTEVWRKYFEDDEIGGASCEDYLKEGYLEELECKTEPVEEDDYDPFNGPAFHLFPVESYNSKGEPQPYGMPDNEFDLEDEIYWGTDPRDAVTVPGVPAKNDESLVVGLGMNKFTWNYQPGDEIGVVVEGTFAVPTKHDDNTYQSVFAFMSDGCKPRKKGAYMVNIKGDENLIRTAKMDIPMLNECLRDNLTKPGLNEHEGLRVSMTYSDDASQAVTSGEDQLLSFDTRALFSESGGMIDTSRLHYNWNIVCGDNRATVCEEGADITGIMREDGNISKTIGANLYSLNVTGNFPEECFNDDSGRGYACITAQVNAGSKGGGTTYGIGEMIVSIQKSGGKLKAFSTDSDGKTVSTREEICGGEGMDFSLCRIVRGEIIGVEMSMPEEGSGDLISWTINGRPYFCNSSVSSECGDESNTNKVFFPVVGSLGDIITVNATYNNPTEGEFANKTVSRSFLIVEPEVHIEPVSGGNYKTLGKYIDANGEEFINKSWRTIEVTPGNSVALKASFTPSFIEKDADVEWSFNGEKSFENTLQVVPDLPANVSLRAVYSPSNVGTLVNLFDINQFSISDSHLNTSIRLVEGSGTDLSSKDKTVGFFATTASNTPAYFFFMLKMALIVSAMLFVSHIALSVTSYNGRRF